MTRQDGALFGLLLVASLIAGCTSQPPVPGEADSSGEHSKADADKLLVVDCLLPAQIRKLGTSLTYLAPRRPVSTTAEDCEIRGGEYTAYDRADYRTALKVWLDSAQQGDPKAQVHVGEIYEKGLGIAPDYVLAAAWYRKAALQGDSSGAINLGYLYEKGLGVDKNLAEALNWYRRASGLNDDDLQFASTIETENQQALGQLRGELSQSQSEATALRTQLQQSRQQLQHDQAALDASERRLKDLQRKLDAGEGSAGGASDGTAPSPTTGKAPAPPAAPGTNTLEREISRHQAELLEQRQRINTLQAELTSKEAKLKQMETAGTAATAEGPTVELLDPPVVLTRGIPTVRLRAITKERIIVGKVAAPSGVSMLTVNDRSVEPDESGIFQSGIPISGQQTPVRIVAIDKRGRRAAINFRLISKTGGAPAPVATPTKPMATPAPQGPIPVDFGNYYALIIGTNKYAHLSPLETAVNDAKAADSILREKYGFQTRLLINADRYTVLSALNEMREKLTQKDNLLVYYAGHGELDYRNDLGYWLPVDAEQDNKANWISNVDIAAILNTINAYHVLVVADSCYSGALTLTSVARLEPDLPENLQLRWYKVMARTRSRTVLTSGGLQPVLDSGGGDHSVFAKAFLRALKDNSSVMEGYRLYREVAYQVEKSAAALGVEQVPEYAPIRHGGHEAGEFFFVPSDKRT